FFFFSSRRRHTRFSRDWSSDVCSSDLELVAMGAASGLASALGRTATPVALEATRETGGVTVSPAEWLTGDPLPPELTPMSYLTEIGRGSCMDRGSVAEGRGRARDTDDE